MINTNKINFIVYVEDQNKSKDLYTALFDRAPALDVDGMTEIQLNDTTYIGLLPGNGIEEILEGNLDHPKQNTSQPRCEIYLYVDALEAYDERALMLGARGIGEVKQRNWGDYSSYVSDGDGNIIAFAKAQPK